MLAIDRDKIAAEQWSFEPERGVDRWRGLLGVCFKSESLSVRTRSPPSCFTHICTATVVETKRLSYYIDLDEINPD